MDGLDQETRGISIQQNLMSFRVLSSARTHILIMCAADPKGR